MSFRVLLPVLLLAACHLSIAAEPVEREPNGPEKGESPREREAWFLLQRLNREGKVGAAERLSALARRKKLESAGIVAFPSQTWRSIGPQPISPERDVSGGGPYVSAGRITALVVDPRSSQTVYAGAAEGGLWKTTDGGTAWIPLTDGQSSLSVGAIALDPQNLDTVYVGTGEANFNADSYFGAGILKSLDGGQTWVNYQDPNLVGSYIGAIAVNPTDSNNLLAAALFGVFQSSDGGETWNNVLPLYAAGSLAFNPDGKNVWAGSSWPYTPADPDAGLYHSTDGGATWAKVTSPVLPTDIGRIAIAIAPSNPQIIYVGISSATAEGDDTDGVYVSQDGGQSWTANTGFTYEGDWYRNTLAVSPTNSSIVVGGGIDLTETINANKTWADISTGGGTHVDQHAAAFSADGTLLYAGNDGGVFVTSDFSTQAPTWTSTNSTLAITQFYPGFSIVATDPSFAIGGTQDNGTVAYSGLSTWQYVSCGDGGGTLVDPTDSQTIWVTCASDGVEISRSGAAFGPFQTAMTGVTDASAEIPFVSVLAGDPSDHNTLYWGGNTALWQSTDGASNWQSATAGLTPQINTVAAIGVISADGNDVIFADLSDDTGLSNAYCTTNAKTPPMAWRQCDNGLPGNPVIQVLRDPRASGSAFLAVGGYGAGHVFHTSNAGALWTDIDGTLPDNPVSALALDPDTGYLYAATDVGAFMTGDDGATWQVLGTGLPDGAATGLQLIEPSRLLRISTHGRSMWDLSVPVPKPVLAAGGLVSSASFGRGGAAAGLSPGSIAAVFGSQMSIATAGASAVPLPTALAGAKLTVGSNATPLFYVSPGQLNVQVPWETPVGTATATVTNGLQASSTPISIAQYAPGIYTLNASGSGQGIVTNVDYSWAAAVGSIPGVTARPATRGDTAVIFCTGLGPVSNQPATGAASPSNPAAMTPTTPLVMVGGVNASVTFSGLTPGAVGLYQINFTVPPTAPTGNAVTLSLSIGGAASNTVTIAVQ